ncbi:uncharacterized protein FPRO_15837 [Fusarium proliferatum ET1]|uniref:Cation efflux protein transmembrane domain-containing protein n=1 Tax=Fusarium proliferatum (strain ET1) TaxID=1227346 RepID=A0A1L7WA41_FUSPR|nr:uncharacterized protein FPRO_15837 [Fusarium proliferatum ET1]CZR49477.1 uncharacterized protein FPRO_15837 [Fusarium proliferatum ET1]
MEYLMEHPQSRDASAIYQTPPCERHDDGVHVTQVGLYANLIMTVLKGVCGFMLNSKTMMADSIHSTTDLLSDIMALVAVKWSLRPATPQFPYGYGKIESLGALGMSATLLLGGTTMGYCSLCGIAARLLPASLFHAPNQVSVRMGNFDRPSFADETMSSMLVLGLSLATVAIKEWLYRESKSKRMVRLFD